MGIRSRLGSSTRGFTITELIVTISIIGILAGLTVMYVPAAQVRSRDADRKADVEAIRQELERQYTEAAINGDATYPSTKGGGGIVAVLDLFSKSALGDAMRAPTQPTGVSVRPVEPNGATNTGPQTPTISEYIYQPFRPDGKLCNYDNPTEYKPCTSWKLWYRLEETGEIKLIESKHQQ